MIHFIYKGIKKADTVIEKVADFILASIMIIILIIYYIDRFNIPTELGWNINVNTQNWLILLGEYATGIVSAIIGAIVAFWVTRKQIEDNNRINQENLRIQNMPLLKYNCNIEEKSDIRLIQLDTNFNDDEGVSQSLDLSIKNIGLNTVRKLYMTIKSDILEKEYDFALKNQGILEKNQEVIIPFVLRLKTNRTYNFEIIIYYKDLLFNVYEQKILLNYELFSRNDGLNYYFNSKIDVEDENKIDELPQFEFEEI